MHCSVAKFVVAAEQCEMGYRMAEGSKDITARALERARKLLGDYEEPKLDPAADEALRDFIAGRECEIPAVDALNEEH